MRPARFLSAGGLFGASVLGVLLLVAAVSLVWTPFNAADADPYHRWLTPAWPHLLGTDATGRDLLSRLMVGAQTTVLVALLSAAVAACVGVPLALLASLTSSWVRQSVSVLLDVLIAFPTLLTAMMLAATFGSSLLTVVAAVGGSFGVSLSRVIRSELVRVAASDYVLAARAAGVGPLENLRRHLLPNVAPVLIVQLSLAMAVSVLAEAGLSYLGYGASPGTPSWGRLLSETQGYLAVHPLTVVWPGLAITLTVLAFTLLGDALRDASDPRLRQRRAEPLPPEDELQAERLPAGEVNEARS